MVGVGDVIAWDMHRVTNAFSIAQPIPYKLHAYHVYKVVFMLSFIAAIIVKQVVVSF